VHGNAIINTDKKSSFPLGPMILSYCFAIHSKFAAKDTAGNDMEIRN